MNSGELVKIIKDGQLIDIYHGGFKKFNAEGYKNYERPFTAEYCHIEIDDVAEFTISKR